MKSKSKFLIYVTIGGFVGTLLRYEIFMFIRSSQYSFPWDTLTVNIVGAFIVGLVASIIIKISNPPVSVRPTVLIGFCGALTTESTMAVNIDKLTSLNELFIAIIFFIVTLVVGLSAVMFGNKLGELITK